MEKELTKLFLNQMTQQKMYKIFGLRKVFHHPDLTAWMSERPALNNVENTIAKHYQGRLLENIDAWNEQELSLNFIGPIFASVDFTVLYRLNFFAQRTISAEIAEYQLIGKPDGMIASGYLEPETPFFCFQEFKKELDSSGDPIGQNLAAMLVGQTWNNNDEVVYGCYVVGRLWFFMVLKGNEYAISREFSAANDDIYEIIKILKALQARLYKSLGITKN